MEMGHMFVEQKWNILKCLSQKKMSPLQLSQTLDTTMANVSQQLRLLEAMNLVKKEKIRNRDKGKPRSLYSLTKDYAYLIPTMQGFAKKRLVPLTEHQKSILRIWFVDNENLHYPIEKLYWELQHHLADINTIFVDNKSGIVYIASDNKEISSITKKSSLTIKTFSRNSLSSTINGLDKNNLIVIYDPEHIIKLK